MPPLRPYFRGQVEVYRTAPLVAAKFDSTLAPKELFVHGLDEGIEGIDLIPTENIQDMFVHGVDEGIRIGIKTYFCRKNTGGGKDQRQTRNKNKRTTPNHKTTT